MEFTTYVYLNWNVTGGVSGATEAVGVAQEEEEERDEVNQRERCVGDSVMCAMSNVAVSVILFQPLISAVG